MDRKEEIIRGEAILGIELGSTRIKAVLISPDSTPLASGGFNWENSQIDGIWTYPLKKVSEGIRACYADLKKSVEQEYGITLTTFKAIGIRPMMHGYLAFDKNDNLLVPFRTWRNNITSEASNALTELFNYPIPQRWSIAHLYQAILNKEEHIGRIAKINTLAGWMHLQLTGTNCLGTNDASGMFPVDTAEKNYYKSMIETFDKQTADRGINWKLNDILPEVRPAGESGGSLTEAGARLLDPSGDLKPGIQLCPPEGDAGTGMVATNSVRLRTGNVSAGTSVFAMIVVEKELSKAHHEIDLFTTPDGSLVAMAHSNNCSTEYSAWIELFGAAAKELGAEISTDELYDRMMKLALTGDPDCGGLLAYGYHSGEHMTGFTEGRPLFVRRSGDKFTPANIIRAQLFTSLCALRTGLNILFDQEKVSVDVLKGHGGFFKTEGVGERIMAAATNTPVSVLSTAGEGGAWGIALLAAFTAREDRSVTLPDYLDSILGSDTAKAVKPDAEDSNGFLKFFERYHAGLAIERAAVDNLPE
ncbi:MAG TPA: ATPase [Spirochaeta sp.]|nr:ATPase [Spirochaeta sp.]